LNIAVFGIGYVGAVLAAALAARGHAIVAVDVSEDKVAAINAGRTPVVEPGLGSLVRDCVGNGALRATTDAVAAVMQSDLVMVCVGTPALASGEPDLSALVSVSEQIGAVLGQARATGRRRIIVVRSTILPGTMDEIVQPILERASGLRVGRDFGLGYMPEFLREGQALDDIERPPMTVIGFSDETTGQQMRALSETPTDELFECDFRTAEAIKFATNAWHAVKVSFANEIGAISRASGVDGRRVMDMLCADTKLNVSRAYLRPGFAFGGSCLPKDLKALGFHGSNRDVELPLLAAALRSNDLHIGRAVDLVLAAGCRDVLMLGLTFKPDTDDLRDSPLVDLARRLVARGHALSIFDPRLSYENLTGRNRQFLQAALPKIAAYLVSSLEEGMARAGAVVVGHQSTAYAALSSLIGPQHRIIDLASGAPELAAQPGYRGICW
jgi:GDP-mannose 6-dehydrogenase